jgi:hypothetical protein
MPGGRLPAAASMCLTEVIGDEQMGNIIEELEPIVFDQNDAADYIHNETGVDKETIEKVLTAEMDYLVEIGLIEMAPIEKEEEA